MTWVLRFRMQQATTGVEKHIATNQPKRLLGVILLTLVFCGSTAACAFVIGIVQELKEETESTQAWLSMSSMVQSSPQG